MGTWNNSYELIPANGADPGFGAEAIRNEKVLTRERLDTEHIFGESETDTSKTGGLHREGQARATVIDSNSLNAERLDEAISVPLAEVGQLKVDMSRLASDARQQDGVNLVNVAGYNISASFTKALSAVMTTYDTSTGDTVVPVTTQLEKLFSWDDFVNLITDQTMTGLKRFTLAPLFTENVKVDEDFDDTGEDDDKGVPASDIHSAVQDGKYFNLWDYSDPLNVDHQTGGQYINRPMQAEVVDAKYVYGVAYG